MRLLELFSGTGSLGKAIGDDWEVTSLDVSFDPTIKQDILEWDYRKHAPPGHYDFIWASPPCTQYSRARTTGGPRDLDGADRLVRKALEIIDYFRPPRGFLLENPATGLLRSRDVVRGLPCFLVTYCSYGYPYRKPTLLFGRLPGFLPRLTCFEQPCDAKRTLGRHLFNAQRGTSGNGVPGLPRETLYTLPPELCRDIYRAVNRNVATTHGQERGGDPPEVH